MVGNHNKTYLFKNLKKKVNPQNIYKIISILALINKFNNLLLYRTVT